MKKIFAILAILLLTFSLSAFGKKSVSGTPGKVKYNTGKAELIDWKGQALGRPVPDWVGAVADGDKKAVKKSLGINNESMIFVLVKDGQDLDFLQTWVDQVDARTEVVSSLEMTIANTVQTELAAQKNMDSETIEKKVKTYSAMATNLTLNGLQKVNDYWTKTRRLKTGIKKGKTDADYEFKTTYYVVYSIDANLYQDQLTSALKNIEDNDASTAMLQEVLSQKCSEALLPTGVGAFE